MISEQPSSAIAFEIAVPRWTAGALELNRLLHPVRDNHVDIGAAAKLLMSILIGNRFLIDAAALVIRSVPDTAIAVGIPAVVKPRELSV